MVSDVQKKARNKWDANNMIVLGCKVRKEKAERFKAVCKSAGTTPNAVFTTAMDDFMVEHGANDYAPTTTKQSTDAVTVNKEE